MNSQSAQNIRSPERRSIDDILARQRRRAQSRRREFPPDFIHGDYRLDEIYDVFGEDGVDRMVFVTRRRGTDGTIRVGAAWFEDYFLVVEVYDDEAALTRLLQERLEERDLVVELALEGMGATSAPIELEKRHVPIRCAEDRLGVLERDTICVTRELERYDAGYGAARHIRTDLLSLVGLSSRLANTGG